MTTRCLNSERYNRQFKDVPRRVLDAAWEEINALGGRPANEYERGVCDTVSKALEVIERLGGQDPLTQRRNEAAR